MRINPAKTISDVKNFWESNPLWVGESKHDVGTVEFFEEHRKIVLDDCLAGEHDKRIFPSSKNSGKVLDMGCGTGLWTVELFQNGCQNIISADLTFNALKLTKKRCDLFGVKAFLTQQNAERLGFKDSVFSHVNCLGVIHHTPDTKTCISEISRVLKYEGTATISVYYRNIFLRIWPMLKWSGKLLSKTGAGLVGRGRENVYSLSDVNEIVRMYDGKENPIGKCYTRLEFIQMISPYFEIKQMFIHFFPSRTLPFRLPKKLHRILDRKFGFMIYATLKKQQ